MTTMHVRQGFVPSETREQGWGFHEACHTPPQEFSMETHPRKLLNTKTSLIREQLAHF